MPYVNIDVDIDLDEISDEDLLEELERRDLLPEQGDSNYKELVEKIYLKRIFGLDFLKETDELIYSVLGRII
jgi:hypothetical protein